MYKVSLAIPIYNVSLFVERALLSALNQTYDNIEYLIVDDKGQDDSMDIVHRIIKDHPRGKDVRIIEHTRIDTAYFERPQPHKILSSAISVEVPSC